MSEYWSTRFNAIEDKLYSYGTVYINDLEREYNRASIEIKKQIEAFYARFAANNDVSLLEAKRILTNKELAELKWSLNEYIKYGKANGLDQRWIKQLENASLRVRIERLQALEMQMRQQLEVLYAARNGRMNSILSDVYQEGYYRSIYEVQRYQGVGQSFQKLQQAEIKRILSRAWAPDGKSFSDRIWSDKNLLISTLHNELVQSLTVGRGLDDIAEIIAGRLNVSKNNAIRLVRTESNYYANASFQASFKETGVDQQQFVATLDARTSAICAEMDGKIFRSEDVNKGINSPPLHVHCRSVMVPYFDKNISYRVARDNKGKTYNVPGDITYKKWYNEYVKPHEIPTGVGKWETTGGGKIITTDAVPTSQHYRTPIRKTPNAVIMYYTNKKAQKNFDLYDENGYLLKQINLGNHNNKKNHPFGQFGEHAHDVTYVDGKLVRTDARELTEDERIKFIGGDELD